ncbi:caspase family protein, partial [Elioraea sp.]|uniref:caspase family protein n=1 Tax=Elioraea sp. TaxID=2185103 RepID=UPI0025BCF164
MTRVVLALLVLVATAMPAAAQRVALVIGNGAYREAPALANPEADARGVAASLSRLGFATDLLLDADRPAMEAAIRRFGEAAVGAEAALVYYAGHAVEVAGRNHLIPVSARIRSDRDLPFETIDFDAVVAQLEGRARVILVFLDACRDNPFRQRLSASGTRGVAAPGLAPVRGPVGTLVAFATAPGQVAQDGFGRNSPFTAALLQHMETPGLEIRPMLGRVRQSVREATAGSQVPWENSSLEGEFFFRPGAAQVATATPPAPDPALNQGAPRSGISPDGATERLFWESVKDSRSPDELQAYLRRYPDGVFADLARTRIAALERAQRPPVPVPPPPPPPVTIEAARPPPPAPTLPAAAPPAAVAAVPAQRAP